MEQLTMTQDVKSLLSQVDPKASRKRSFFFSLFPAKGMDLDSYWSGGSRDYYAIIELATGKRHDVGSNHPMFEAGKPRYLGTLPEGFVLLQYGVFCGKTATPYVYLNQADAPRLISA
jgi:hypothetical protein